MDPLLLLVIVIIFFLASYRFSYLGYFLFDENFYDGWVGWIIVPLPLPMSLAIRVHLMLEVINEIWKNFSALYTDEFCIILGLQFAVQLMHNHGCISFLGILKSVLMPFPLPSFHCIWFTCCHYLLKKERKKGKELAEAFS